MKKLTCVLGLGAILPALVLAEATDSYLPIYDLVANSSASNSSVAGRFSLGSRWTGDWQGHSPRFFYVGSSFSLVSNWVELSPSSLTVTNPPNVDSPARVEFSLTLPPESSHGGELMVLLAGSTQTSFVEAPLTAITGPTTLTRSLTNAVLPITRPTGSLANNILPITFMRPVGLESSFFWSPMNQTIQLHHPYEGTWGPDDFSKPQVFVLESGAAVPGAPWQEVNAANDSTFSISSTLGARAVNISFAGPSGGKVMILCSEVFSVDGRDWLQRQGVIRALP